jgi:uncharacterized LabA/DUF88 family protein
MTRAGAAPVEPTAKRTVAFVDGQNLFYAAKQAFGYRYPNYDPLLLSRAVCAAQGWTLVGTHFYTGLPAIEDDPFWNHFSTAKLAVMGTRGVRTFARRLKYRRQSTRLPDGRLAIVLIGQEKGVDIRIALDVVRLGRDNRYDVALIFSQDQDLSEVADEVRAIAAEQNRWIKVACAFPVGCGYANARGINRTDWIRIERAAYDACVDPNDYRPKPRS